VDRHLKWQRSRLREIFTKQRIDRVRAKACAGTTCWQHGAAGAKELGRGEEETRRVVFVTKKVRHMCFGHEQISHDSRFFFTPCTSTLLGMRALLAIITSPIPDTRPLFLRRGFQARTDGRRYCALAPAKRCERAMRRANGARALGIVLRVLHHCLIESRTAGRTPLASVCVCKCTTAQEFIRRFTKGDPAAKTCFPSMCE
jgi:hypothetical protein